MKPIEFDEDSLVIKYLRLFDATMPADSCELIWKLIFYTIFGIAIGAGLLVGLYFLIGAPLYGIYLWYHGISAATNGYVRLAHAVVFAYPIAGIFILCMIGYFKYKERKAAIRRSNWNNGIVEEPSALSKAYDAWKNKMCVPVTVRRRNS